MGDRGERRNIDEVEGAEGGGIERKKKRVKTEMNLFISIEIKIMTSWFFFLINNYKRPMTFVGH